MTEERIEMEETYTFECSRELKRFVLPCVITILMTIWLPFRLFKGNDNGEGHWLGNTIVIIILLVSICVAFKFLIDVYTRLIIDEQCVCLKTPFRAVKITWDTILGVRIYDEKVFRIISAQYEIFFNVDNYISSEYLTALLKDYLSPVMSRPLPSTSDEVLLNLINNIYRDCPNASYLKVYSKIYAVDRKIKMKREKVKQLVKSLRNEI